MSKFLYEIAHIYNGADYKKNPPGGAIPIYGTGGLMGYTSIPLYNGPAVLSGRKGSINNPIFVEGEFWNVDTIFCIKANAGIDTKWLFYNFLSTDLTILNEATGVPSVNSKALYKLKFKWFELPIQLHISHILTIADTVIEKTQATISKFKAIKQGMLQDLFTRGIDITTGKLRPKYEDAPELYKESKLGFIPIGWVDKKIEDVAKVNGRVGWKGYTVSDLRETGPLALGASHIDKENKLDLSKPIHLSIEKFLESPEIMVHYGDLLIVQRGTIGKIVIIDTEIGDATINPSMVLLNSIQTDNFFLYCQLCSFIGQRQIEILTSQTGVPMISQEQINNIKIVVPKDNKETDAIANRIKAIDNQLSTETTLLHKLQRLKSGLMEDLLSGSRIVKTNHESDGGNI